MIYDIKILAIHITNSYVAVYLRMYISHSTDNVITYSIIHKTKQMYVREQLPQEVTILFRVSVYESANTALFIYAMNWDYNIIH